MQTFLVAPAQFIEQMLQLGGERRFGVHALLQPFTDGVANGPAGPVIELLKVPIDTAIHVLVSWRVGTRRVPLRHVEWLSNVKSQLRNLFPVTTRSCRFPEQKSPGASGRGVVVREGQIGISSSG